MENQSASANHTYSFAFAVGGLALAHELIAREGNEDRRKKKQRVIALRRDLIRDAFPEETKGARMISRIIPRMPSDLPEDQKAMLFIDLAFSNPFSPYELKYGDSDFREALRQVARLIGLPEGRVDSILATKKEVAKGYQNFDFGKVLAIGIGGAVVLGLGGWAAAPIIGSALGGAAGLSGAAATAHGLALLGGGSLAAGGAGMAGGLYLVTGAAVAIGGTTVGGSAFLIQLGAAGAKAELIKLQTSYREVLLHSQLHTKKATNAIRSLAVDRQEVQAKLEEERQLNEKNAARLKELEETVEALDNAITWMTKEKGAA